MTANVADLSIFDDFLSSEDIDWRESHQKCLSQRH